MFHTLGFIVALVWKICCVIPSRHDSTTIQEDRCHHQLAVSATLANSTAFWQSSHQHLLKHGILYNFFPRSSKHINELLLVGAVQKKYPSSCSASYLWWMTCEKSSTKDMVHLRRDKGYSGVAAGSRSSHAFFLLTPPFSAVSMKQIHYHWLWCTIN